MPLTMHQSMAFSAPVTGGYVYVLLLQSGDIGGNFHIRQDLALNTRHPETATVPFFPMLVTVVSTAGRSLMSSMAVLGLPAAFTVRRSSGRIVQQIHVPALLGVGGMELGQMLAVVLHALKAADHNGVLALGHVLEVLEESGHIAVLV